MKTHADLSNFSVPVAPDVSGGSLLLGTFFLWMSELIAL